MTVKLTGYRKMSFTDDKTGELITGTSIYYLHKDMDVVGLVAAKKFIKGGSKLPELVPDCDYIMEFAPNGKLLDFESVA